MDEALLVIAKKQNNRSRPSFNTIEKVFEICGLHWLDKNIRSENETNAQMEIRMPSFRSICQFSMLFNHGFQCSKCCGEQRVTLHMAEVKSNDMGCMLLQIRASRMHR